MLLCLTPWKLFCLFLLFSWGFFVFFGNSCNFGLNRPVTMPMKDAIEKTIRHSRIGSAAESVMIDAAFEEQLDILVNSLCKQMLDYGVDVTKLVERRDSGYYWVRFKGALEIQPAFWSDATKGWFVTGAKVGYPSEEFEYISDEQCLKP